MAKFPQIGLGAPFFRSGATLGDTIALNHYNRVTAAGGVLPCGVAALTSIINAICTALGLTTEAQFNAAVPQGLDPHYSGYLAGAGSGTTLGQACQKIFNWAGASGDVSQGTAGSMPLLLAHTSGSNYLFSPLSVSDNCSTPNAAANQIVGDIEVVLNFSYYSVANVNFIAKRSGGANVAYAVNTQFQGRPQFVFTQNGSTVITATSSTAITTSTNWLKVTRVQSSGDVIFYTSTNGTTWTQLGTTQSTTSGNIFNGTSVLLIGNNAVGGTDGMGGKMYRVTISNAIGGSPVVDFNPNTYNAATSQTSWVSATGETWTLNQSTGNTFHAQIVDRTYVQGNGTTTSMNAASVAGTQPYNEFLAANRIGTGAFISRATGNARGHDATNYTLANGATLNFANTTTTRNVLTYRSNGASSGIALNNGTETTGNSGTNNGTDLTICQGAHVWASLIQTSVNCDTTQRAAMYSVLRTMNNL
jgi:hypothetical protein